MSTSQLWSILRARKLVVLSVLLATLLVAALVATLRPATYSASAPVLLDIRVDPLNATPVYGLVASNVLATQADIIRSERVAQRAVQLLRPDGQALDPQALQAEARGLQKRLEVRPGRESNVIRINGLGATAEEAAQVANAFAQAYMDVSLEIRTQPAGRYTEWFEDQVGAARARLARAQRALSEYQQQSGIVTADERMDFETVRLNNLVQQLSALHNNGRGGSAAVASDASPLVNNLRQDAARLEAKIGQASANLGPRHPEMLQMRSELAAMRSRIQGESSRVGAAAGQSASSLRERERDLRAAIDEQKARVLALNTNRGALSVLRSDVEAAQKDFEAVTASAAQTRLQSRSNQTNVIKLSPAVPPESPDGPGMPQLLALALVAGSFAGVAAALLLELFQRRVRSEGDLATLPNMRVIGTLPANDMFAPPRLGSSSLRSHHP